MRVIISLIVLFISSSILGQTDSLETSTHISKEEAIKKSKRKVGYSISYSELIENQWVIVYSKYVGSTPDCITISSGVCGVFKNVSTRIDARTGKVLKYSSYNSISGGGGNVPSEVQYLQLKKGRKKKMKVNNRTITVYY